MSASSTNTCKTCPKRTHHHTGQCYSCRCRFQEVNRPELKSLPTTLLRGRSCLPRMRASTIDESERQYNG
jgi:hypothetical protein